jgi:hypothetical protein
VSGRGHHQALTGSLILQFGTRAQERSGFLFISYAIPLDESRRLGHPTLQAAGAISEWRSRRFNHVVVDTIVIHDDGISAELVAAGMSLPTSLARSALRARAKARPSRPAARGQPRVFEVFCEVAPRAQRFWEVCSFVEKESFESFPLR